MEISVRLIQSEWWPNDGVKPGNPQFDDLLSDIKVNGIREPIIINLKWKIMDGNHRLAVAKLLGIEYIKVRVWTGTEFVE